LIIQSRVQIYDTINNQTEVDVAVADGYSFCWYI